MTSVPDFSEMAAHFAGHPAAIEAAAAQRSQAAGVRPQFAARPVHPAAEALRAGGGVSAGHSLRAPSLNARLGCLLTSQQAQHSTRGQNFTVAIPQRLAFRSLLGARAVQLAGGAEGYALNLEFAYSSPSGSVYVVQGFATGFGDGPLTGNGWARSCSCPDFVKRRGPAVGSLRGEARCCKHMRLLLLLVSQWRGEMPWVGCVPQSHLAAGQGFQLQPFG